MMGKTAIILGATGLTGNLLLRKLVQNDTYDRIVLFSRHQTNIKHPKIEEHLIDLFKLEEHKEKFEADEVFCCIGTTKSKTPDEATYKKIDHGIPVTAAKLSAENNIGTFLVISALGADANSRIFYNKVKGEMQMDVLDQSIKNTYILQPSLISGDREEGRFFENLAKSTMKLVNPLLIGSLKKYRSIHPELIAEAMIRVAENGYSEIIIPSDEIQEIALK